VEKKEYIQEMFSGISRRYDFLNSLLSLGRDKYWRRFAANMLPSGYILDVCSGTGDVAIEVSKKSRVIATDFCEEMLLLCAGKIKKKDISIIQSDAENLSFKNETFDGAIVAFGIRNVADVKKALAEMSRVVKKGGRVVILEFSLPENRIFSLMYRLYFQKVLPFIGGVFSKKKAYCYLPSSVMEFPERNEFVELMKGAGMVGVEFHDLTFGIVTVYSGVIK